MFITLIRRITVQTFSSLSAKEKENMQLTINVFDMLPNEAEIANPESVRISKTNRLTRIANIKLVNRRHEYLRVVIRYGDVWQRLLGKRNYILTFYGADSPIGGKEACLKK